MKPAAEYKWNTKSYDPVSSNYMYACIHIFPQLVGETWNDRILGILHAARPSAIRVTTGEVHTDAKQWRITVLVNEDSVITAIEQEVEIALVSLRDDLDTDKLLKKLGS